MTDPGPASAFPVRGWESQLEDFWCRWLGGDPDWFRNPQYLAYLRDALARAPGYGINTFMLMGRHDQGEIHTFVEHGHWPALAARLTDADRARAREQAAVLDDLAREARQVGVALYLWDHEIQLPPGFAHLYPEARGVGHAICPSAAIVWRFLADQYDEFFPRVPHLAGITLVFAEVQLKMLQGSPCRCERCRHRTGADFVRKMIVTARAACERHGRRLVARNHGSSWEEIEAVLAAVRAVDRPGSFTAMSKMVPADFFTLQAPPDPSTVKLAGIPRLLEDTAGGEFRGKTHTVCLPAAYYARHLRHAAAHGSSGAVIRLDHSAYPRSVFASPNEFNVWVTAQLLRDPQQPLDDLWRQWASGRYGEAAAAGVVAALRRSADIWEHSTNSFGFYCTSAHGCIAPFFWGHYNCYENLLRVAPFLTRQSAENQRRYEQLLDPTPATLDEVVAERDQAIRWAEESVAALAEIRPRLPGEAYAELAHYLGVQLEAARLWRELGELFFTGLAIVRANELPPGLLARLSAATQRALQQGRRMEERFGRRCWPVEVDADRRGTSLERALAALWGEFLDRLFGLEPLTLGEAKAPDRPPRSDAERLYLAVLEAAAGMGARAVDLAGEPEGARLHGEDAALVATAASGAQLRLPAATPTGAPELSGACRVKVAADGEGGVAVDRAD